MQAALEIGEAATFKVALANDIENIVVCGLGGSGIGGNLLAELLRSELSVPVLVNKGYSLPAFVGPRSLLILSSYSGNTEETLQLAEQASAKNLLPVCVTSGGKLAAMAAANHWNLITIPSGFPPRACLAYSTTQLFYVLQQAKLIDGSFKDKLKGAAALLQQQQEPIKQQAEQLAGRLLNKVIIAYAEDKYESTILRLKQQINENSKMCCWYNVIPEANHNELVGWRQAVDNLAVIFFRSEDEFYRNTHRILYKKDLFATISQAVFEVFAKGDNAFEKRFYLIHFGDWLSYYLAVLQKIDPVEVNVITRLKDKLESVSGSSF